jgi:GNAT superfamily N-acetyltransferase
MMENVAVNMIRPKLDNIPRFELPAPYGLRWFEEGDDKAWDMIQQNAERHIDMTKCLHGMAFGADLEKLRRRQCFLIDGGGRSVGTGAAWHEDDHHGEAYGRVHWIAILPEHQGKGLAKSLMTAVCERLCELGHRQALLGTHTVRMAAINLYLKFGFVPDIRSDADRAVWQRVAVELDHPVLQVF